MTVNPSAVTHASMLHGRYGLSGAQPPPVFATALRQVAAERVAV